MKLMPPPDLALAIDSETLQADLAENRQRIEIELLKAALREMSHRLAGRIIHEYPPLPPVVCYVGCKRPH